jgi:small neutral amino acid transporter SnatA (MarC family)
VNVAVSLLALVAAGNPARRRRALSVDDTRIVAAGAVLYAVWLVGLAAIATPVLDGLDVSAPNLRIAVGFVLAPVALHDLVRRRPGAGAALAGGRAALVPVLFPVLARPEVALLGLAIGADHGVVWAIAAAVLAAGSVAGWHRVGRDRDGSAVFARVEGGLARLLAALTVALAVVILVDGIFAI